MMILYDISPIILDKILPLNETRTVILPIDAVFLIDEKQHPIISSFLQHFLLVVTATVFVGTESVIIMIISHIAGLFHVASYQIQKAVLVETSASYLGQDSANIKSLSYIVRGVTAHRMGLQYIRDIQNYCSISYAPSIVFGVIVASIHLFCLSQTVFRVSDIRETMLSMIVITSILTFAFWVNLAAENMINSAGSIPLST
ncbi:uncharacterized protein LOC143264891 [Megachile rotundata]|uniref:uncharacterized protein LOC143264891 n=1 Tax=Megachile rotundata TaxID=143995 RepID=UPI003FD2BED9